MSYDSRITDLEARLARAEERIAQLEANPSNIFIGPRNSQPAIGFDISKCPCNPALGGSGICGCILGGSTVTCSVGVIE